MGQNILPYDVGRDGHIEFPTEDQIREHAAEGQGDADVLYLRQQTHNGARALEFAHAYMGNIIDHRKHLSDGGCLEDGIEVLLGQMFENHPLVIDAEQAWVDQPEVALDMADVVQKTLMMQTLMGMAEFLIQTLDYLAAREDYITHQMIEVENAVDSHPLIKALKDAGAQFEMNGMMGTVHEDRKNMLHQPAVGWLGRVRNDYIKKCAETSDAWVAGPVHHWTKDMNDGELCPMVKGVRDGNPLMQFHEDGRVKVDGAGNMTEGHEGCL